MEGLVLAEKPEEGKRKGKYYADAVGAFDIETTAKDDDNAVMYIWQYALYDYNRDESWVTWGRTWEEWECLRKRIAEHLGGGRVVTYVHNLSYEFQFLAGLEQFTDVKALKERKVLLAETEGIEYRCSYIWTNKSLAKFLQEMKVENQKESGEVFDYRKKRYPWTELTDEEKRYCLHDVMGLVEATVAKLHNDGDSLYTVPATSTGYIRRDVKQAMYQQTGLIKRLQPSPEVYTALRKAFRGGDTHANRYYAGKILTDVKSVDRSSSYPDVMLNKRFPMTPFKPLVGGDYAMLRAVAEGKAVLAHIEMRHVALADRYNGFPYVSFDKCLKCVNPVLDNGRVLSADALEMWVTDCDLRILTRDYVGDMRFVEGYAANKDYLPENFRKVIIGYYERKTALKGDAAREYEYAKSKNLLNAAYGMSATDPGKPDIEFDGYEYVKKDVNLSKTLKTAFLPYQWGVWVTGYAREELHEMTDIAGHDFVYADTDSCKYLGDKDFSAYNAEKMADSLESGASAVDCKGKRHYMGIAEDEGKYERFITWGAKKYAFEKEGKLGITIAGVGKIAGAKELAAAGGIEALKPGFCFTAGGGTASVYNDDADYWQDVEGHRLHVTRNICIKDSTYVLGITRDYADRLLEAAELLAAEEQDCNTVLPL